LLLEAAQLVLGLVLLRHVEHETDEPLGRAVGVDQEASLRVHPALRGTWGQETVFRGQLAGLAGGREGFLDRWPVLGMDEFLPAFVGPVEAAGRDAEDAFELGRDEDRPGDGPLAACRGLASAPLERDGARGLLREVEHLLARTQLLLDALALGN